MSFSQHSVPTARTALYGSLTTADPDIKIKMNSEIPIGRVAEPEEMAEAVLRLCSDAAFFITVHIMPIDGGMTSK